MFPVTQVIGMALQVAGTIGGNLSAGKTRRDLTKIGKQDPDYQESPYAKQNLGLAQSLYNARMGGAAALERNIYGTQANTLANINRNATDSSQALALAAGAQGQTNDAFGKLGVMEAQDKQQRYQNLTAAQAGMTEEHTKNFDDSVRRWQDQLGILMKRHEIRQQQWSNVSNLGSSISGAGSMGFGGGK